MKIGIFDSGIGGLNVLKELIEKYPNVEYIYFGDTINLPYGSKTKEELLDLGIRIIRFFETQKVDKIVIACGTCSSLVEEYQNHTSIPLIDVITPTIEYVKEKYHKVALLATSATIKNGNFEQKLRQENIEVFPLGCPSFVPYLEGLSENLEIEEELKPLYNMEYEAVILGCTHYPLLKKEIAKTLCAPIIDMGKVLSTKIKLEDSKPMLTVYMSKITPLLEKNVEQILKRKILLKEKNLSV